VSLPRKFMNFSSQNGLIIWCVLGVLFLRFMCPMDCSCMINFIEVPVFRSSAEGKNKNTCQNIRGRDPCNPCGVDAYGRRAGLRDACRAAALFVAYSSSRPSCDLSPVQHFRRSLSRMTTMLRCRAMLWITSQSVAPPGFCNTGGSEVWVYRGSRVRSPPVPVVLSVYQRGSLLDGLAAYLSCDTKNFHDNESTHILHNFGRPPIGGKLPPPPTGGATDHSLAAGR